MILRKFLLLYCFGHCLADEALRPPDIHTPNSSKTIFKSLNQRFSVVCNATGLPSPRVEWRKGEIEGNNTISGNISFDPYTGVLTFERFSENEEGEYRCFSTNHFEAPEGRTFAVSISPPLTFRLMRLEEIERELETVSLNGIEYQYIKLICANVKVVAESVKYYWFKGIEHVLVTLDDRMYIDKYGSLHISHISKIDESEHLRCGVSIEAKKTAWIRLGLIHKLQIDIIDQVSPPTIAPKIEYSEDVLSQLNGSARLECMFSGYNPRETMLIFWILNNGNIIQDNDRFMLRHGNRSLVINNVEEEDEGYYFCVAKLGLIWSKRNSIFLNVTHKPIFRENQGPKDATVIEGKDVEMHCLARSLKDEVSPSPPVWTINGKSIDSHHDRLKFHSDVYSLTIRSVKKPADICCVSCVVSNSVGKTVGEGCINVLKPIIIVEAPEENIIIDPYDVQTILNFTVVATSDISEKLTFNWTFFRKDSNMVGFPNFTFHDQVFNVAYFNFSSMSKEEQASILGFYLLNISHKYEYKLISIEVIEKSKLPKPDVTWTLYWYVVLFIGMLLVVLVSLIFIIRQMSHRRSYNVDKRETQAGLDPVKELNEYHNRQFSQAGASNNPEIVPQVDSDLDNPHFGDIEARQHEYEVEVDVHF